MKNLFIVVFFLEIYQFFLLFSKLLSDREMLAWNLLSKGSSEYNFEKKLQDNISPSNQNFELQKEEELIEFKEKQQKEQNKFSSEYIKNEVLTLTSDTSFSDDCLETKLQAKFDKYDQCLNNQKKNLCMS